MDIWAWMESTRNELREQGHDELVRMLDRLPNDAIEGRVDRVDAVVPYAIAQAKALRSPWIEVFVRHWRLQTHCTEQGAAALPEAVELFEFANRDETLGCPQSVCVTQDLAIAYGKTDGPGYARERIAVATETLGRIDPSWGCFDCLTNEWANALIDDGCPDDAIAAVDAQMRQMLDAGVPIENHFRRNQAQVLVDAGRYEQGLAMIDELLDERATSQSEHAVMQLRFLKADALSRLHRGPEAAEVLPGPDEAEQHGSRSRWASITERLVQQGAAPNHAGLGVVLRSFLDTYQASGAHRPGFEVGAAHARLALARGATWVAEEALAAMRQLRDLLVIDGGADVVIAGVEAAIAAAPPTTLPVPAHELASYLRDLEDHDVELEIAWTRAALEQAPELVDLVPVLAQLLAFTGRYVEAHHLLAARVADDPSDEALVGLLCEMLLASGDREALDALLDSIAETQPSLSWWYRARVAFGDDRFEECIEWCQRIVADDPEVINTRRLWAGAARRLDDHEAALSQFEHLIPRVDPGPDDWERMIDATALGRWDLVRDSCRRLEIELDPDAPAEGEIDQFWGPAGIRFVTDDGDEQTVSALRTGPVTALVISIAANEATQHAGDLVLFDATPVDMPPDDEAERAAFVYTYPAVKVLRTGGFTGWVLDGVDPGADAWHAFRSALDDRGWLVWIYSDESYRVVNPFGGDLPGVYGRIATPPGVTPLEADRVMTELTLSWAHPVVWPDLADAAGADAARHERIIDAYGL